MGFRDLFDGLRTAIPWPRRRVAAIEPPAHQLTSVPAVVAALREITAELDEGDGIGHFNRMYLQVTELVEARLKQDYFANNEFMERLDIVFAHLYLDAVRADREGLVLAQCWEPVFARRQAPLAPIQFAIAGMNAHINHDLPVAVVATCRQLGLDPRSPEVRSDYDKVTLLLSEVHEQVRQAFLDGVVLAVDREMSPLLTLVGSWSIGRARDVAWVNCEVLWELGRSTALAEEFRVSLCRSVGLAGRTLLVQVAEPV